MNPLELHEISETSLRILNPFTEDKLMLLGEVCHLEPGQRLLDLASGKGELLCRWAERFGIGGLGVDISTVFVPLARARAVELNVADRVEFVLADASTYEAEPHAFDVGTCIGATWIGSGPAGTVELLSRAVRPGGLVLIGEPFWHEPPPADVLAVESPDRPDEFVSLAETVERLTGSGGALVEMVIADHDSWDRYTASQFWTVEEWLRANPTHEHADAMRAFVDGARRNYLQYRRHYMGWGIFVLRLP